MSTCSAGDEFQVSSLIEYDEGPLDGCYIDTGYTTWGTIRYSLGGVTYSAALAPTVPIVFAHQASDADHNVWALGYEIQDYGTGRDTVCRDADLQDVDTLHPTEVRQWDCSNGSAGYVLEDYVTMTCGCSTPAPVVAPPPSPAPEPTSTCSSGDSFLVDTVLTEGGETLAGCFQYTGDTRLDIPTYYVGTTEELFDEAPMIFALQLLADTPVWALGLERLGYGVETIVTCVDANRQNASTIHPTEVREWDCDDNYDGSLTNPVLTSCGCETAAPTCGPVGSHGPARASATPSPGSVSASAQTSAVAGSSDGGGGGSVGIIVGGAVGGVLVLFALVIAILFKTGRLKIGTRGESSSGTSATV